MTLSLLHAHCAQVRVVQRLLAAGADAERVNTSDRCALVYACMGPSLPQQKGSILQLLLQAGARRGMGRAYARGSPLDPTRPRCAQHLAALMRSLLSPSPPSISFPPCSLLARLLIARPLAPSVLYASHPRAPSALPPPP